MNPLKFSAGEFEVEIYAGGHPAWWSVSYKGEKIVGTVDHCELKDLIYCLERALAQGRATMEQMERGTPYKHSHEFD